MSTDHAPGSRRNSARRQRVYTSSGVIVEWYDFALFAFMTPTLAPLFFPDSNPAISMISVFGVFAAGYLVRPLGGIVIGRIGDTRGRRTALRLATVLMLVPLLGITVLPTYAQIGLWAPLLLTAMRLLQGFSVGGEYSGALATLSETGDPAQRGRSIASGLATSMGGLLLASMTAAATSIIWGEEALAEGTWRIPFAIGFLLCLLAYALQSRLDETHVFLRDVELPDLATEAARESQPPDVAVRHDPSPVAMLLRDHRRAVLLMVALGVWSAVTAYAVLIWLPSFMATRGNLTQQSSLLVSTFMSTLYIVMVFPAAILGDRFGRRRLMALTAAAYVAITIPVFAIIDTGAVVLSALAASALVLLQTLVDSGTLPEMTELVPANVRYTGVALTYNVAMIVGGFTPLVATAITAATGNDLAAAGILMAVALVEIPVILSLRKPLAQPVT